MVREVENNSVPEWVEILLGEKFFTPCSLHISCKKNDKTFFCLFCRSAICFSCFSSHRTHALLQIRRYVYHEVVLLGDAEKLMNCSLVQPYTTNRAKVVFLKERRRGKRRGLRSSSSSSSSGGGGWRSNNNNGNLCITCFRNLQYPYLFCSLSCKINQKVNEKIEIINKQKRKYENLPPRTTTENQTPTSVLDRDFSSAAAVKLAKKNNRSCVKSLAAVLCRPRCFPISGFATAVNRRKGVPQRSPLT
ncbi:uncharacterized protein LOC101221644 [Cucumis sativus]|uniref:B box-type domain-containing protein n=1 Tax=Cucumis sativus TaxID=3659 RepID=A0A0A0KKT3_CUCSA|nr:uncharacterized protein LOC101221644 [Cucumis sativus]KGN50223.1 hypothetical protein Csa_000124 [Cucumis sativus]